MCVTALLCLRIHTAGYCRGSNPQQTQRNKRTKKRKTKKRSKPPFLSPTQGRISLNPSTNTLSTGGFKNDSFATPQSFEPPQFDCINVGCETFLNDDTDKEYKCSHCLEPYLACNFDPKNSSLLFLVCKHRFCRQCIESMEVLQNCPIADCRGTNHGKSLFQLDEKLIKRIIKKSCSEVDSEAALNNGVITDDVAGSRRRNQSLTSG